MMRKLPRLLSIVLERMDLGADGADRLRQFLCDQRPDIAMDRSDRIGIRKERPYRLLGNFAKTDTASMIRTMTRDVHSLELAIATNSTARLD